jgi:hypothetical protein
MFGLSLNYAKKKNKIQSIKPKLFENILIWNYKGDELVTTCVYNTKRRSKFTYGGAGSEEEMCKTLRTVFFQFSIPLFIYFKIYFNW